LTRLRVPAAGIPVLHCAETPITDLCSRSR
jgi:hypothetical protein